MAVNKNLVFNFLVKNITDLRSSFYSKIHRHPQLDTNFNIIINPYYYVTYKAMNLTLNQTLDRFLYPSDIGIVINPLEYTIMKSMKNLIFEGKDFELNLLTLPIAIEQYLITDRFNSIQKFKYK